MVWDPSPGADRIATVSRSDKTLRLWDLRTKREEVVPVDKIDQCAAVAWSPEQGTTLVLRGERTLGVMDVRKLRTFTTQRKFEYKVNDCQYSSSSDQLITATELGEIEFLDSTTLETTRRLVTHTQQALLVRNTTEMMCTAGNDSMVQVWDRGDMSCVFTVDTLMSRVRSMQICGAGRYLVASADKTFEVVDLLTGHAVYSPIIGTVVDEITSIACDQQTNSSKSSSSLLLAYSCANGMDVHVQQVATTV